MEATSTPLPDSPAHRQSPTYTPNRSVSDDWLSCNLGQTPSSIHTNCSCYTTTPNASPIHRGSRTHSMNKTSTSCQRSSSKKSVLPSNRDLDWAVADAYFRGPNFEPKNLLNLFEETAMEGQP